MITNHYESWVNSILLEKNSNFPSWFDLGTLHCYGCSMLLPVWVYVRNVNIKSSFILKPLRNKCYLVQNGSIHILPAVEGGILDYHTKEEHRLRWSPGWYSSPSVVIWCTTLNCRLYVLYMYYTEYCINYMRFNCILIFHLGCLPIEDCKWNFCHWN